MDKLQPCGFSPCVPMVVGQVQEIMDGLVSAMFKGVETIVELGHP
jgi:hypothetical protein